MDEPKEIWTFDHSNFKVMGPHEILGEMDNYWRYKHNDSAFIYFRPKSEATYTKKEAVEACYRHHEKRLKQEQEDLDEKKRLLKKFYSEELYE